MVETWLGKPSKLEHCKIWEKFPKGEGIFGLGGESRIFTKFPSGIFPKFYHVGVVKASLIVDNSDHNPQKGEGVNKICHKVPKQHISYFWKGGGLI